MSEVKANNQVNLSTWHVLEHPGTFVKPYCTQVDPSSSSNYKYNFDYNHISAWSVVISSEQSYITDNRQFQNRSSTHPPTPDSPLSYHTPRKKKEQASKQDFTYLSLAYWGIALCHSNKSTIVQRRAGKRKIPKTTKKKNPTHKNPHTGFSEGKKQKEQQQHFVPHFHGNKCHRITGITRPREK